MSESVAGGHEAERMTEEQLAELGRLLSDPEAAAAHLPEGERRKYEEAQRSVVRARQKARREGREVWL